MGSMIGQRLGAYQLEAELGRGSMGIVYLARHVTQGKTFAIKVLLDALVTDSSFITRFTREARIVSALHHPNLVSVYEAGREGESLYFVMEYFPGATAGQLLRERKRLPYGEVVEIAAQTADALAYAHAAGRLVHRDIKPENILVDRWRRVKVLDFGLARIEGLDTITRQGTVVGSLYYVSPEQLLGRKLDGRTDVYALGVSMYEMLTGQRPYRGQTLPEMSDAILYGAATPPSKLEPSIPRSLEAIIARAMARDLSQRYANAGELLTALRGLQAALAPGGATTAPTQPMATPVASEAPKVNEYDVRAGRERRDGREAQDTQIDLSGANGQTPIAPDTNAPVLTARPHLPSAFQPALQRTLRTSLRPTTLEPAPNSPQPNHSPRPTDSQD